MKLLTRNMLLLHLFFFNSILSSCDIDFFDAAVGYGFCTKSKPVIQQMIAASNPRIYLLSYPRSGNTWSRYWLEVLTGRPTAHFWSTANPSNLPIGLMVGHSLNFSKAPIWKVHNRKELNFSKFKYNPKQDLLIFVIRNPKEAIIRHVGKPDVDNLSTGHIFKNFEIYFDDLKVYDEWAEDKKILLYYEDMISDPAQVMTKALLFLKDPLSGLEDFMLQYEYHKKTALKVYDYNGGSQSQGNDILFHSYKLSAAERKKIDEWINATYPYLWNKYLKDRYSEEILETKGLYRRLLE